MTSSAAVPEDLASYAVAASDQGPRLETKARDLKTALDALRATAGRQEFLSAVPDADLGLRLLAVRWAQLGGWVGEVGRAFRDADTTTALGPVSLPDTVLDLKVGAYEPPEAEVLTVEGRTVVDTGAGDDEVVVTYLDDGTMLVVVNGEQVYEGDPAALVVRGNAGDDTMTGDAAPDWAGETATMDGGAGDDVLTGTHGDDTLVGGLGSDRLTGGAGADELDGGWGEDRLRGDSGDDTLDGAWGDDYLEGGSGDDVARGGGARDQIYGGDGADTLDGNGGEDCIDGGAGADVMSGGDHDDVVSGGEGDDTLSGGDGADVVYAGPGVDRVEAEAGPGDADRLFVQADDTVVGGEHHDVELVTIDESLIDVITVEGTPEYVQRVRADLVTLASSPTGQQLLAGLAEHDIVIREGGGNKWTGGNEVLYQAGDTLNYQPGMAPISVLHHELTHAYTGLTDNRVTGPYVGPDLEQIRTEVEVEYADGTTATVVLDTDGDGQVEAEEFYVDRNHDGVVDARDFDLNGDGRVYFDDGWGPSNFERQAVGLPVDHDQNPFTPDVQPWELEGYPAEMGENALRTEMGLDLRDEY